MLEHGEQIEKSLDGVARGAEIRVTYPAGAVMHVGVQPVVRQQVRVLVS